jgi:sporulation protein YlmC with PRC-barrel domain
MFNRVRCGYSGSSDRKRCEEEWIVAREDRLRELEEKYEGYKVYDNRGERIGKVDDLFIDEADREEYIGVKMGFFGRKSTLIPMDIARVNEADKAIEVSESKDHIKDAPSFDDDEDITPEYEDRIRSHFGLESMERSQSSYGAYSGPRDEEHERDYSERDDRAGRERSTGGAADRFEREGATSESPSSRETETFEEGGRTKVRRRVIREEIIEEEPNDRYS